MNTDKSKLDGVELREEDLEDVSGGRYYYENPKVMYRKCKRCGKAFAFNPTTDYGRGLALTGLCIHCKKDPQ